MPGIELVAEHLGTTPDGMLKTIVMQPAGEVNADGNGGPRWVLAVVRGDHEVNEGKVRDAVGFAVAVAANTRTTPLASANRIATRCTVCVRARRGEAA